MAKDFVTTLVYARSFPIVGRGCYYLLKILGLEIPISVVVGEDLEIPHSGFGIVIHPWTKIGDRVKIYPGVTIGRGDIHRAITGSNFKGVEVSNDVILAAGCKIIGGEGLLKIGQGTIIGANAVLLQSTGENEIWAGVPAKRIGVREPPV